MIFLILDTETGGVNPEDPTIEVAGILYSAELGTVLGSASVLLPTAENPAQKINRIPPAATQVFPPEPTLALLREFSEYADYCLAWNAQFDQPRCQPLGVGVAKTWVCAQHDLEWPLASRKGASLVSTALEHGVTVVGAHRALSDCFLIVALLQSLGIDLWPLLNSACNRAESPTVEVTAKVSYQDRDLAKSHGFRWDPDRRLWTRKAKQCDLTEFPFEVVLSG